jgi:hypothetical protein
MFEQMILSAVGELRQTFLAQFLQLEKRLDFMCENKQPDVIEAGGVKNITNNYYVDKNRPQNGQSGRERQVPQQLSSFDAAQMMQRYVSAGLLDADWQPLHLSWPQSALLAKDASDRLSIDDVWQQFGQLWDIGPQTLRSYFNRAMNQKKTLRFLDALKRVHESQL